MQPVFSLQHLANRLTHVEKEVRRIRDELMYLRQGTAAHVLAYAWADNETQKRWMKDFLAALGIQGIPFGIQDLQKKMESAMLLPNELSRSLIDAREE